MNKHFNFHNNRKYLLHKAYLAKPILPICSEFVTNLVSCPFFQLKKGIRFFFGWEEKVANEHSKHAKQRLTVKHFKTDRILAYHQSITKTRYMDSMTYTIYYPSIIPLVLLTGTLSFVYNSKRQHLRVETRERHYCYDFQSYFCVE